VGRSPGQDGPVPVAVPASRRRIAPPRPGSPVGRDEFDPIRPVTNLSKWPGEPEETARAVLFLASDESSFVVGENIFVDGGVMAMEVG
jgi:NAD(P)-dependent dehydrogenase (short-subunit alcohol dehydrogenase family)